MASDFESGALPLCHLSYKGFEQEPYKRGKPPNRFRPGGLERTLFALLVYFIFYGIDLSLPRAVGIDDKLKLKDKLELREELRERW